MVFKFQQVNNMPDIASADRYQVYYPPLPGVDNKMLSLLTSHVTPPQKAISHIKVRLFGHPIGFRGGSEFENTLAITFYENVRGDATRSLQNWMDLVRDKDGYSQRKHKYSGEGKLEIFNTIGEPFITIPLYNMFPVIRELPELNDSNTTAFEISTTFNVDLGDPDGNI